MSGPFDAGLGDDEHPFLDRFGCDPQRGRVFVLWALFGVSGRSGGEVSHHHLITIHLACDFRGLGTEFFDASGWQEVARAFNATALSCGGVLASSFGMCLEP